MVDYISIRFVVTLKRLPDFIPAYKTKTNPAGDRPGGKERTMKYDFREDVDGIIQLMNNDVLVDVVMGKIDLKKVARETLYGRGLNLDGSRG